MVEVLLFDRIYTPMEANDKSKRAIMSLGFFGLVNILFFLQTWLFLSFY